MIGRAEVEPSQDGDAVERDVGSDGAGHAAAGRRRSGGTFAPRTNPGGWIRGAVEFGLRGWATVCARWRSRLGHEPDQGFDALTGSGASEGTRGCGRTGLFGVPKDGLNPAAIEASASPATNWVCFMESRKEVADAGVRRGGVGGHASSHGSGTGATAERLICESGRGRCDCADTEVARRGRAGCGGFLAEQIAAAAESFGGRRKHRGGGRGGCLGCRGRQE